MSFDEPKEHPLHPDGLLERSASINRQMDVLSRRLATLRAMSAAECEAARRLLGQAYLLRKKPTGERND